MTLGENTFPIGYFYILSKMNGMALDIDPTKQVGQGTPIVTAPKKEEKPQRDTQLWMHQSGFLTNKFSGLVLDIGKSKRFTAIFTGEDNLYLDKMKSPEEAVDQRFGYSSENGYIYTLEDPTRVVDIRKKEDKEGATLMIYERAENPEEGINQLWQLELADPPKVVDSSDDEEDESKSARLSAWFGSWWGWGSDKKREVLNEDALKSAHKQVYEKNKHHLAYEVIAGAVAVQAVKYYMNKQEENGEDVHFKGAKEAIAGFAAAEMVKVFMDRGTDDDDDDDDDEKKLQKQSMLQKMAVSAATNYFETKYKS